MQWLLALVRYLLVNLSHVTSILTHGQNSDLKIATHSKQRPRIVLSVRWLLYACIFIGISFEESLMVGHSYCIA